VLTYLQFYTDKRSSLTNEYKDIMSARCHSINSSVIEGVVQYREPSQLHTSLGWGERGVGGHNQLSRRQLRDLLQGSLDETNIQSTVLRIYNDAKRC
jgi:hypothetical protein